MTESIEHQTLRVPFAAFLESQKQHSNYLNFSTKYLQLYSIFNFDTERKKIKLRTLNTQ